MKCHKIQNLLPLYVSKDLPTDAMQEVRLHLEQCSACMTECESLRKSVSALRASALPLSEADRLQAGVWQRLRPVIRGAKRSQHNPASRAWWQFSFVQPVGVAAAVLLLVVGFFVYSHNRTPSVTNNGPGETPLVREIASTTPKETTLPASVVPVSTSPSSLGNKDMDIGIHARDLPTEIGMQWGAPDGIGVMVVGVEVYSPADQAHMEPGDIIISLDGASVDGEETFRLLLDEHDRSQPVVLEIIRDGRRVIQSLLPDVKPPSRLFHHYRRDLDLERLVKTNDIINQLIDYEQKFYERIDR